MAFTQLNPPIPMIVEGKGNGMAFGMIDYGPEHHLLWVTAIDANGEIWCVPNPKARMQPNWSMGRGRPSFDKPAGSTSGDADLRVVGLDRA